jgi:putative phosphotransacetylase
MQSKPDTRIGSLLLSEKILKKKEIDTALKRKEQLTGVNVHLRLGEIIVDSGISEASPVAEILHKQRDMQLKANSLGHILLELGYVNQDQLEQAMEAHLDIFAPLGEILVDQGICILEQIDEALKLQAIRRVAALRRPLASSFDPVNVMEILVEENVDEIIRKMGGCGCNQCRGNVVAISLNGLAARYISDIDKFLGSLNQYREEYGDMVRHRIEKAVEQVKRFPKLSCKLASKTAAGEVLGLITCRISNHHVHLSENHVLLLFGPGHELTKWKDLVQPGQYAARETVTLKGPKGAIERVRVLGPPRSESQVEISGTDQFRLGIQAPVRESGKIENTPGIVMVGTEDSVELERGVIRAWRHIHMTQKDGKQYRLKNRDIVNVRLQGDRTTIVEDVLVRITKTSALEMHIDTDEGNAAGVPQESDAEILTPDEKH